jgi:hypothetical protein
MVMIIWGTLGVVGGVSLRGLLLVTAARRDGVRLTRRQLRDARRASDEPRYRHSQAAASRS